MLLFANVVFPPIFLSAAALRAWPVFIGGILVAMISHALLFVAIFHPRCPWLGPISRRFRTKEKAVWLTIDDGPDGERSRRLARELQARGVRATFFVIGGRVRAQPEIPPALLASGHTVANHSDTHPRGRMWCALPGDLRREIQGGGLAVARVGGKARWFRAPVGHKSPALHGALRDSEARLIGWTVGGLDGWDAEPADFAQRLAAAAEPGAIILLHEARPFSVETVLAVADALRARGFTFAIPEEADLE